MDNLLLDIRYGVRTLLRRPGFTVVAALTLAIGIGANTAIFSVINGVLLQPLPYREPDRLMKVLQTSATPGKAPMSSIWPYPRFEAVRDQNVSFSEVAAYAKRAFDLTGTEEAEHLECELVSWNYFSLLGIEPVRGRAFLADEDRTPGAYPVAMIGYSLWQRRMGGDPQVVGKTLELEKHKLTIVGVLPKGFKGQSGLAEVWIPMMMTSVMLSPQLLTQKLSYWAEVIARLKHGVTQAAAQAELELLRERIEEQMPGPSGSRPSGSGKESFSIVALRDANLDPAVRRSFLILAAAVGFMLLIACANTAGLLTARALARRREFAIRLALGASRRRIGRQLLTESVLLSLAGGALGTLVALWGVELLTTFKPADSAPFWSAYARTFDFYTIGIDGPVLAFNVALSLATGIAFGLLPAWQASRSDVNKSLKDGSGAVVGNRRINIRSLLVVSEIGLSVVLLSGAGLMLNSLIRLNSVRLGFNPENVLAMRAFSRDSGLAYQEQLLERVSALPGVESAGVGSVAPLYGHFAIGPLTIEGRTDQDDMAGFVGVHSVSAGYFSTLGINLLQGRGFTEDDRVGAKRVAIVNREAAARFWPDANPIGQRIKLAFTAEYPNAEESIEVVGISENVKYGRVEEMNEPEVYTPYSQPLGMIGVVVVRATGDREALMASIRREVKSLDKNVPVYDVKSMSARAAEVTSRTRFSAFLLVLFSAVALVLSGVGIYGVMAYTVAGRTREIGIRLALGARAADVFRLILGQGVLLTFAGFGIGLVGARAATRFLRSQLYEVSPSDPLTFVVISVVIVGVALGACFLPARRATKVDPMVALRCE